ncbi:Putative phage protein Gp37/Gp68 (plasmid) [Magnetospirillum sp. XM-1]|uniref:DUF5131 family protein n=1 Tax=Magnetospirillum sp. XM-1 TaxID=1663591 RepID=UPI00073DF606|nr:DUF5131 family protein [Magnetospirillum sp. XM-1]CUW41956.1 Putative phage protein Gp37/Gp68 [Magnetospirillum sp. XM-1]
MGQSTGIAWAKGTVSPVKGCEKYGPECRICYAVGWAARHQGIGSRGYEGVVANGDWTGRIGLVPEAIDEIRRSRVRGLFVNSMSDTFHRGVPDEFVERMFAAMAANPHPEARFFVLTKRSDRMAEVSQRIAFDARIWAGVTVGCRASLKRLDDLRRVEAPGRRWVSMEPLLERVDIRPWLADGTLDWVVIAGESGAGWRPLDWAWVEDIVDACDERGVPVFVKQGAGRFPKTDCEYPPRIRGVVRHGMPADLA